jgi:phosphoglycolate phosphatase-like HAD superfamily hydrolase
MNIGLFDLDGSLADYAGQLKQDLNKVLNKTDLDKLNELGIWAVDESEPFKSLIRLIRHQPNWWKNLTPITDGLDIFNIAYQIGFDNHVLTKGPKHYPQAWKEKVEWCQQYLGQDIDIHITSDKGMVYGKFLYDDYPDYMLRWLSRRPRGLGIMPVNGFNKDFSHPQVIKWDGTNYDEVKEALEKCYERNNCRAKDH